jgi:hypothetical protein
MSRRCGNDYLTATESSRHAQGHDRNVGHFASRPEHTLVVAIGRWIDGTILDSVSQVPA